MNVGGPAFVGRPVRSLLQAVAAGPPPTAGPSLDQQQVATSPPLVGNCSFIFPLPNLLFVLFPISLNSCYVVS
uniref:Uncharacterized protein n=1 Tax=Arundo donax TaxID=35708 RepID=A0A0A8ZJC4_ARUDO